FSLTDEDVIDLRAVLSGYDPLEDDIADFVQFTNAGSNSELAVDLDGAGTVYGWTQIATVNGHINLDAETLLTSGHLLAA
ncbi:MAG: type I secretion C-terminal target domain-containing protein, partial [Rhodospirillaceae bacterium]